MFIDETTVSVKAGDGGNGCYAHERTKYMPKGRANGGNGGRGGHILIQASTSVHTLQDVSYRKHYKSRRGEHGKGSNKTGGNGEDLIITVPAGTIVTDCATDTILCDCVEPGKKYLIARGGRGGRGNAALTTRSNPSPQYVEPGAPGESKRLHLSLKVLADVGLVGRPNAGKSTFISRVSGARPKIADYPFTTTRPYLGIVRFDETHDSIVMADIPGLIEDSHLDKGMGIRFLKHIERTKVLAFLIECTSDDPRAELRLLKRELEEYSPELLEKPSCCILTKIDLLPEEDRAGLSHGWLAMSAVTGAGVEAVLGEFRAMCAGLVTDC